MLRVLHTARLSSPLEISATFCGGHAVPRGAKPAQAASAVIEQQLPAVMQEAAAGNLAVENFDVFCEKGVFEIEDSRRMLVAGKKSGLR